MSAQQRLREAIRLALLEHIDFSSRPQLLAFWLKRVLEGVEEAGAYHDDGSFVVWPEDV